MDRNEFVSLFDEVKNDVNAMEEIFNDFCNRNNFNSCAKDDREFWDWCGYQFAGDMRYFYIICSDRNGDADADFFVFDGDVDDEIYGFYDEEDYADGMIDTLWKLVNRADLFYNNDKEKETHFTNMVKRLETLIEKVSN